VYFSSFPNENDKEKDSREAVEGADTDGDGKLTIFEMVEKYDQFLTSRVLMKALTNPPKKDEL